MNSLHLVLSVLVFSALSLAGVSRSHAESAPAPGKTVKLLTIGNSFAADATEELKAMAKADGNTLIMLGANRAGHTLEQHAGYVRAYEKDPKDPNGHPYTDPKTGQKMALSLREALERDKWDYVTIQQASPKSFRPETFEPFAGQLVDYVKKYAPQAEILVHETWAYRQDHPLLNKDPHFTQKEMYKRLKAAYHELADRYGLRMIPVGDAFQIARAEPRWTFTYPDPLFDYKSPAKDAVPKEPGSINKGWVWEVDSTTGKLVFRLDGIHANSDGKFLGAATFYEVLFKADVRKNTYRPEKVTEEDAIRLREIAHEAVERLQKGEPTPQKP